MDKFEIAYEEILKGSPVGFFKASTIIKKKQYENPVDFFKDIVLIKDSDDVPCIFDKTNLIDEERHPEVKYGNSIISLIEDNAKHYVSKISFEQVKNKISKYWKYFGKLNSLKNEKDLLIIKGSFSNSRHLVISILNQVQKAERYSNEVVEDICEYFKNDLSTVDGFFKSEDEWCFICLNEDSYTKTTISHEFTHYVQDILQINLVDSKMTYTDEELDKLRINLQLSENDLNYVFDKNKFSTHVYVNLFDGFQKLFWLQLKNEKYPNKNWETFIENYRRLIEDDRNNIMLSSLGRLWVEQNEKTGISLRLLSAMMLLNQEEQFNKVFDCLKPKKNI